MTAVEYKKNRKAMKLTQYKLAELIGTSRETISRRESGSLKITEEAALAILQLLSSNSQFACRSDSEGHA